MLEGLTALESTLVNYPLIAVGAESCSLLYCQPVLRSFVQECMAIWQTLGLVFLYTANPELSLKKKGFNPVLNIQNADSRTSYLKK